MTDEQPAAPEPTDGAFPDDPTYLRMLLENVADVILHTVGGVVQWISPSVRELLGYEPTELVGRTTTALWHPADLEAAVALRDAAYAGHLGRDTLRMRHRDGSYRWVTVRIGPRTTSNGTAVAVASLRDVTTERHALDALATSEERFRLLAESASDVVWAEDGNGRLIWISPSITDVLGWDVDAVIGTSALDLVSDEDRSGVAAMATAVAQGTPLVEREIRFRTATGPTKWMSMRTRQVRSDAHLAVARTVSLRDISARVETSQALVTSENRFRRAMSDAAFGMCLAAPDGRFLEVNEALCDYLGYDAPTLRSRTWQSVTDPDDVAEDLALAQQVLDGSIDFYRLTKRFVHADGSRRLADMTVSGIRNADGALDCFVAQVVDTTARTLAEQHLAESEHRFRLLAENASDAVWAVDEEGIIRWSSPSIRNLLGWSVEEVTGTGSFDWLVPDDLEHALSVRAEVRRTDQARSTEVRFRTADGGTRWIAATSRPVSGGDPSLVRAVTLRDIDAEVAARRSVAAHLAQLRVILDASPDEITRIDDEGRVDFVNARVVERTSQPAATWVGRSVTELAPTDTFAAAVRAHVAAVVDTGEPLESELWTAEADGPRWYLVRFAPEYGPLRSVHHIVLQIRDVTDQKAAETELIQAAMHDSLTGLANRVAVADEITHALGAGRRNQHATGVLLIDLDHFKFINDSLGHAVGDDLIRAAAERIVEVTRAGDVVGRQGGDEFVVVMRDLDDPTEAVHVAERLVAAFRRPISIGDSELFSTASIGVTVADPNGRDAGDLLREADTAMYAAKNAGRDRLSVFNEELRRIVSERLQIENELRAPVERGELSLWYQPEIDLRTGELRAVEALLRWNHPSGELYTADRFIDVAEESGLILGIGEWVIRRACEQSAAWARRRDAPLTVRVNLSAVQLSEPSLVDTFDDAIAQSGARPETLCVEITESALMRDVATVRRNLDQIRERHIKIAIDDFGTGYASLTYLRQFPVDVLKIDRSFVSQITSADFDRRLVGGVIALSHSLDIPVTAEGVETDDQATILRDFGCEGAQGWLFSGAVPAAEIDELLAAS